MDGPLDDRIAERQQRTRGPPPRRPRANYPRDGIRKSTREDRANLDKWVVRLRELMSVADVDSDWVHDRYDDDPSPNNGNGNGYGRSRSRRDEYADDRRSPERESRVPLPAKLRVDNLHYDLTEDDLFDLFTRIAPVRDAKLTFDRAGRSEGVAFVTYDHVADARTAIKEFDGANAKGQPIRLTLLPPPPRQTKRDNPFDRVENPRSLFDRIDNPAGSRGRRRSYSPDAVGGNGFRDGSRRGNRGNDRRSNVNRPAPDNIDRYIPGQNGRSGSHRDGRRPGERRERKPDAAPRSGARPKKTTEELDAEMDDYWGGPNNNSTEPGTTQQEAAPAASADDIDMIE